MKDAFGKELEIGDFEMTTGGKPMTNYNERLDEIFKTSPIDKEVPEDIWETIYATWTGLWTDGYGEWDEKQPSDIYPLDELLSTQARDRLKKAITSLFKELVAEAKPEMPYEKLKSCPVCGEPQYNHSGDVHFDYGVNQYEENLLKALEEVWTSQLQNELGHRILDVAFKERQKNGI